MRYIHCLRQEKRSRGTFTCVYVYVCAHMCVYYLFVCAYAHVLEHHDARGSQRTISESVLYFQHVGSEA